MFRNSKNKPTYSIRKYSVGVASVLIGMVAFSGGHVAHADEESAVATLPDADNPQVATESSVATTTVAMEGLTLDQPAQDSVETVPDVASPQVKGEAVADTAQVMTNAQEETATTYDLDGQGAQMPYTSYQAEEANLTGGASVVHSTDMASTAVEASQQTYVELPQKEAAVTIEVAEPANAINLRYTLPDGADGQLDVQVNGSSVGQLDLSSHSAWQYLKGDHEYDQPIEGASARFRFDETRLLLRDVQLKTGDKLSLVKKKDDQVPYGIDLIELEQAPAPLAQPANSINILSKGASANDDQDNTVALLAAVEEAKMTGQAIYIPEGRFNFDRQVNIEANNLKIFGAGIWHTQLHFTSDQRYGGGIVFGHNSNGIELSHLYMDSNLTSRYNEDAQYKAISGTLGKYSKIHDVWIQHFEVGMWIGDYDQTGNMRYTDGLLVENARIRNNLADGINFAQGTKNSTVKNTHIRGNGDDGLAIWSSISQGTDAAAEENNKFLNNTIELGWRAAGIGIFGGKGHEISGNLIKDTFAGAGIRVNTVFAGHNFDLNDTGIQIHDNVLLRTGTTDDLYQQQRGALDFQEVRGEIKQVTVSDNKLLNNLINPAITSTRPLGDNGNADIRLINNVIDNSAVIVGEYANQSSANLMSETASTTAISEVPSSAVDSSASVSASSEAVISEQASETISSEVVTSLVTSHELVSETVSSESATEVQPSEIVSSDSVSEVQPSETVSSEVVSEAQPSETVSSESASEVQPSETASSEVVSEAVQDSATMASQSQEQTSQAYQTTSETTSPNHNASETILTSEENSSAQSSASAIKQSASLWTSTSHIAVVAPSETNETPMTSEGDATVDPIRQVGSTNLSTGSTLPLVIKETSESPVRQALSQAVTDIPSHLVDNQQTSSLTLNESWEAHLQAFVSGLMANVVSETMSPALAALETAEDQKDQDNQMETKTARTSETSKDDKPNGSKLVASGDSASQATKESTSQQNQGLSTPLVIVGILGATALSLAYLTTQRKKSNHKD